MRMYIRFLWWQTAGLLAVLIVFATFAPTTFWLYLRYSMLAIAVGLALAIALPISHRRHLSSRSWFWDVFVTISISLISAAARVNGSEWHLEYVLPIRMALSAGNWNTEILKKNLSNENL